MELKLNRKPIAEAIEADCPLSSDPWLSKKLPSPISSNSRVPSFCPTARVFTVICEAVQETPLLHVSDLSSHRSSHLHSFPPAIPLLPLPGAFLYTAQIWKAWENLALKSL